MLTTAHFQSAYILHTKPYRDSSLLIDALTESQGRISLIAKAARGLRSKHSRFKGLLQAFVPLSLSWRGKTELLNLSNAEPSGVFLPQLTGKLLICGLYLNELLMRLLYRYDPHPSLFQAYQTALMTLPQNPNLVLRLFEKKLLAELGYALHLKQENQSRQLIFPEQYYQFIPSQGLFIRLDTSIANQASLFSGASLLAIYHEEWHTPDQLLDAKRLFRIALHHLLEGKTIRSRELLRYSD